MQWLVIVQRSFLQVESRSSEFMDKDIKSWHSSSLMLWVSGWWYDKSSLASFATGLIGVDLMGFLWSVRVVSDGCALIWYCLQLGLFPTICGGINLAWLLLYSLMFWWTILCLVSLLGIQYSWLLWLLSIFLRLLYLRSEEFWFHLAPMMVSYPSAEACWFQSTVIIST